MNRCLQHVSGYCATQGTLRTFATQFNASRNLGLEAGDAINYYAVYDQQDVTDTTYQKKICASFKLLQQVLNMVVSRSIIPPCCNTKPFPSRLSSKTVL